LLLGRIQIHQTDNTGWRAYRVWPILVDNYFDNFPFIAVLPEVVINVRMIIL